MTTQPEGLTFPTDYPIKVVGRAAPGLRARIDAIVDAHAGPLGPERIAERASGQGNYLSITYLIVARDREQVVALVGALTRAEGVVMVI